MNLTPDQITQCRAEFESWAKDKYYMLGDGISWYVSDSTQHAWEGFQSAWRPRMTVADIVSILVSHQDSAINDNGADINCILDYDYEAVAKEIYRASVGQR